MRGLRVKNKWPLCHAWHHVDTNCYNSRCFSWVQTQIHSTSCAKLRLVHLALYERRIFFFYFVFFRPLLKYKPRPQNRQDDRLSAYPLFKTTQALCGKKSSLWGKKGRLEAKWRLLLENVRAAGLMTPFKDSLLCVALFSNPNLFCLHAAGSEHRDAALDVQDVSYLLPIVCPSFHSCGALP